MSTETDVLIEQAKPDAADSATVIPDVSLESQRDFAMTERQKAEDEIKTYEENKKQYLDMLEKDRDSLRIPPSVDVTKIPRPEFELNKRFIIASSVLMLASIVGSASMKLGSTGMMSALTGAINGLLTGKKERYDMEISNYDRMRENIITKHKLEVEEYKSIRSQKDKSIQEVMQEIRLAYLKHGNNLKHFDATINGINKMIDAKERMGDKFKNQTRLESGKKTSYEKDYLFSLGTFKSSHPGLSDKDARAKFGTFDEWYMRVHPAGGKKDKPSPHFGAPKTYGKVFTDALNEAKKKNPKATEQEIIDALKKKGFDETK